MHGALYLPFAVAAFLLIGVHHYAKHPELRGTERFIQHHDLRDAVFYLLKSHEGWQLLTLLVAVGLAL